MPSKKRGAKYHTFDAPEKALIRTFLDDCWLALERERSAVGDKARASGMAWAAAKYQYLQNVESYLRQRYSYIGAAPPGEEASANTDQPSSDRPAGKGRD